MAAFAATPATTSAGPIFGVEVSPDFRDDAVEDPVETDRDESGFDRPAGFDGGTGFDVAGLGAGAGFDGIAAFVVAGFDGVTGFDPDAGFDKSFAGSEGV